MNQKRKCTFHDCKYRDYKKDLCDLSEIKCKQGETNDFEIYNNYNQKKS